MDLDWDLDWDLEDLCRRDSAENSCDIGIADLEKAPKAYSAQSFCWEFLVGSCWIVCCCDFDRK